MMTYSSGKAHPNCVSDMSGQSSISEVVDPLPGYEDEGEVEEPDQPSQRSGNEEHDEGKLYISCRPITGRTSLPLP